MLIKWLKRLVTNKRATAHALECRTAHPHSLVMSELMLSFRDLVHQQTHGVMYMPPRLSIANDAANILCRLDGEAALESRWVVAQDPSFVSELLARITSNIEGIDDAMDRLMWKQILETPNPMSLARFIVELVAPVRV